MGTTIDTGKADFFVENEGNIRRYVDDLEQTGARAELALQNAATTDQKVKSAVLNAHHELADLKMQLH